MVLNYTNESEVSKIVSSLKNKKIKGPDGIRNEILKSCSPIIEKYVVGNFNNCIEKLSMNVHESSMKVLS